MEEPTTGMVQLLYSPSAPAGSAPWTKAALAPPVSRHWKLTGLMSCALKLKTACLPKVGLPVSAVRGGVVSTVHSWELASVYPACSHTKLA